MALFGHRHWTGPVCFRSRLNTFANLPYHIFAIKEGDSAVRWPVPSWLPWTTDKDLSQPTSFAEFFIKFSFFWLVECVSYSYLDSADRSMNFKANVQSAKCDDSLQQGWYRFRGDAGDEMPTSCVAVFNCGTHAPGWLSTKHPTVDQGAVHAKVCFHWGKTCCRWSMNIKVRNCSGFYVYELNKAPKCRLRYCGNGAQG